MRFTLAFGFFLAPCLQAGAQEPQELQERVEQLEKEVRELRDQQSRTVSANPLTVLNPTLTVIGNFLWRLDDRGVEIEDGERIDDTFNVRELELDMRAAVDPYADGVAILALESEVPGEFEAALEELYATIKSLPIPGWETPPLGTTLRLGRMRAEFGRLNRLHLHDLPQSTYGLTLADFLGEEGYVANGVTSTSFLASLGTWGVVQLQLGAFQGGGSEIAPDRDRPAYLGGLVVFAQPADLHSVDLGLYAHYGGTDEDAGRRLSATTLSVDAMYKWKRDEWTSFIVAGQVFWSDRKFSEGVDLDLDGIPDVFTVEESRPVGFLAWAQYQLDRRWYVGVRYDRSELLADDSVSHTRLTPYVSWYASEFFRIRVSGERTWSDLDDEDGLLSFLFEVNIVFGAHPPEPFWVNK